MTPARVTLVTLGVEDVARSTAFYEALGWERARQSVESAAFMIGDGVVLSLWQRAEMIADGGEGDLPPGSGSAGLAVNFASEAETSEAYDRAVAAGASPVKPPAKASWGGFSGNFRDPDGHLWEFAHNPFFALDERGRIDLTKEPAA
ncbi:VOC family protein [Aureimonas leprariae]|uniref:VOC family protein n=1 Tax=Plantimonas leprariae TaxID=2615207 RepID=A0A7V7PT07_9HYPH|nr:VOC family protein [Aureimonas leprariae]KAB0682716.1 VOC family protein [Aureimonas leprariae]